jgi:hypothetical protein
LQEAYNPGTCPLDLRNLLELAYILEENIQATLESGIIISHSPPAMEKFESLITFYTTPELNRKQLKYSPYTLWNQLCDISKHTTLEDTNTYTILHSIFTGTQEKLSEMGDQEENQIPTPQKVTYPPVTSAPTNFWVNDTSVSTLSSLILEQLKKDQATPELNNNAILCQSPIANDVYNELCQRFRFNVIRHQGSVSTITMLKLFKSFTSALRSSDPSLLILPYSASKQHYSPLSTVKQIQALEENQMLQYFKPFYQRQLYSISGFLHISSQLSFKEITSLTKVQEWLDSNQYFIKLCPSQEEEMVPLGALCYSNVLMHQEDLKEAITQHPSWKTHFSGSPLIIDIYLGDFLVSNKKEKMLFISGEKSRVPVLNTFFKVLYDGRSKQYPNASMMLYIPFNERTHMSPQFREKILYNHQKYSGQCSVLAVGGLHDLNTKVKLKTGQLTSLRELLKSIPATPGMTRPFLFQHFKPNSLKTVHMAVYQKMDHDNVMERTKTLEGEIALVLAKGEETKVFINPTDGMWYGSVHQNKQGQSVKTTHLSKTGQEYARHINQLLNSPPKKRPQQTQMETNSHTQQF